MPLKFEEFYLDLDRYRLIRGAEPVAVEPQVLELIVFLVRAAGKVVSKEDLVEEVWKGKFVTDSAVTRCVFEARRVLGDDAKQERFIKTVHGRGYRWVAPVSEAGEVDSAETAEAGAGGRASRWRVALLSGVLLLTLVGWWVVGRGGNDPVDEPAPPRVVQHIAILPIAIEEDSAELTLLGLAMTDYLESYLTRSGFLRVVSASSLEEALFSTTSVEAFAREHDLEHLLEGSLSRSNSSDRATLHLRFHSLDPQGRLRPVELGEFELMYLSANTELKAFNRVRKEIAEKIGSKISPFFELASDKGLEPGDIDAYRLYLTAEARLSESYCDGGRAIDLLEQALERDPVFAPAWYLLGTAYYNTVWACGESAELLDKALAAVERSGELTGGDLPRVTATRVTFLTETGKIEEAFELIRDLGPDLTTAEAHLSVDYVLRFAGYLEPAQEMFDRALEIDPTYLANSANGAVPNSLLYQGRLQEYLSRLGSTSPAYYRYYRGFATMLLGDRETARKILEPAFRQNPSALFGRLSRALLATLDGDLEVARSIVTEVERQRLELGMADGELTYKQAQLYALAGDNAAAVRNFRRAVDEGFFCAPYFAIDPVLDALRGDAGFEEAFASAGRRHREFGRRFGLDPVLP